VTDVAPVAGALVAAVALLAGFAVGSLPAARLVARSAGSDAPAEGDHPQGAADVGRLAGPGWGFLALTADLAKGVLPVAIGIVTVSWAIGWAAALGAVLGAHRAASRRPTGDGRVSATGDGCVAPADGVDPVGAVATFVGAAFTLAPPAGAVSALVGLAVLGAGRVAGRDARVAAVVAGIGTYPALFLAVEQDPVRLLGIGLLYLVALVPVGATRIR
jgi:glycerol-3-phosphate acyltransferase PlsY